MLSFAMTKTFPREGQKIPVLYKEKNPSILQHIPEITGHKIFDVVTAEAVLWKELSLPSFM